MTTWTIHIKENLGASDLAAASSFARHLRVILASWGPLPGRAAF